MTLPVRHILLRDAEWLGRSHGLERAPEGSLSLRRVPAPALGEPVEHDGPFQVEPSGIAALDELNVFIADGERGRLLLAQRQCDASFVKHIGGSPAGLAIHEGILYVADRARRCIRRFDGVALDERPAIGVGLDDPTDVAVDSQGRVHVLDRGAQRVVRLKANGSVDPAYAPAAVQPRFMALSEDDELVVSDASGELIRIFDAAGASAGIITGVASAPAPQPRALAIRGGLLFAANAADGEILVFDLHARVQVGEIIACHTPVAAMTCDPSGNLLLKQDGGPDYLRFAAHAGRLARGFIEAGPFDAGENNDWERAALTLSVPGSARLSTFVAANRSATVMWRHAPGLDTLVAPNPGPAPHDPVTRLAIPDTRRYLWLRAELSGDGRTGAVLEQLAAETRGSSYLDDLPRIYRRDDQATRFLERWLAQFRSQIDDRERRLEEAGRAWDPQGAPAKGLATAAAAIAFDVPPGLQPDAERALLARAPGLYARRGTLEGVAEMVEVHSGIRPQIFEDFRARRVWQLGTTSLLGVDTQLAAATPEGFVVPRDARTDPAYAGLRGEYYGGIDFHEPLFARTDARLDFEPLALRDREQDPVARYSVRWQGQIKSRFSEVYLLSLVFTGAVRVWIDGRRLDVEAAPAAAESSFNARVTLDANRWHELRIELRSVSGDQRFQFFWASRHQRREIVPRECLYSILDDHADLVAPPPATFDVGHAVVGESTPLAASEFGDGLFGDYAHLFTVVAPAGSCQDAAARAALREVIEAEKPAHTDYHLCFVEPRMRVGFQARLGIDAVVAKGPPPLRLDGTRLGHDSYLDDAPEGTRLGARARLGQDTVVR